MRGFIESRVSSGDYHHEGEYIRDLVRGDKERLNQEQRLAKLLKKAEQSGLSDKSLPDIMLAVKQKLKGDSRL